MRNLRINKPEEIRDYWARKTGPSFIKMKNNKKSLLQNSVTPLIKVLQKSGEPTLHQKSDKGLSKGLPILAKVDAKRNRGYEKNFHNMTT